ncbi:IS701 family transposase [Streptomyces cahuitamycinicus]|uniref:IS701 family transposase n=1 Tax=Streptomyces cahuitamycinicus TaxID=2070367 RepID=A0A2N8TB58_9ACTN|nr:IS701 family transposase [Streptomyces cahuitamycinicus]PNG16220.1 IS701 family transposase [Streptomyces cahuitamycinicus]
MDMRQVEGLRAELAGFVADVFASVPRRDQRAKGDCYLRGLMLDGRRKSIQPMAERLPDGNEQNLQQFVNQSPWDPQPVQRRIAERMVPLISPDAFVVDDVSFPKDGRMSVAVARQYCGALGKQANCQVAVSVHAVSDTASVPLRWRLFLPKEWEQDSERRGACGVPDEVGHREKWRLALDALDEAAGWGLTPPVVVADAGYGQSHPFRVGLRERGLDYITAVRGDTSAHPGDAVPSTPERAGRIGAHRLPRYREAARPVKDLVMAAGRRSLRRCTWRQGSRGAMTSRFLVMEIRPAGVAARKAAREQAGGRDAWDGTLPAETLLAEWPPHQDEPTDYWLTSLPADTVLRRLVRLAKIRWRIEHDYRELKHGLGLDHFEGRSWTGWHHHATLVTAAHAFLTEQRLTPKADTPACPSTRSSTQSRTC